MAGARVVLRAADPIDAGHWITVRTERIEDEKWPANVRIEAALLDHDQAPYMVVLITGGIGDVWTTIARMVMYWGPLRISEADA